MIYEETGVSISIYRGRVSIEEMKAFLATEDLSAPPPTSVLVICDLTEFESMDGTTRKFAAESPKRGKRHFTAYVGTNFAMQVFVRMWTRATNFLQGERMFNGFFDNHTDARNWLLAEREKFERSL